MLKELVRRFGIPPLNRHDREQLSKNQYLSDKRDCRTQSV